MTESLKVQARALQRAPRKDGQRSVAIAQGAVTYTTGRPCHNGHRAERWTVNGLCIECAAANRNTESYKITQLNAKKRWMVANRARVRITENARRAKNKDNINKAARIKYRSSLLVRAKSLVKSARERARKKGLSFELSTNLIFSRMLKGTCEVTGIQFDIGDVTSRTNPWAPSLDRKNAASGYTAENTQIVCWLYNTAKHEFNHDDVLRLARALCVFEDTKSNKD